MVAYIPEIAHVEMALRTVFPDLPALEPLYVLGGGLGSIVVETGAGLVFRITKNQAVAERHAREARLL